MALLDDNVRQTRSKSKTQDRQLRSSTKIDYNERKTISNEKKKARRNAAEKRLNEQKQLLKKEQRKEKKANKNMKTRPIKRLLLRSPTELASVLRIEKELRERDILQQVKARRLRFAVRCLQKEQDKLGLTNQELEAIRKGEVLHVDRVRLNNIANGIDILDSDGYLALAAETYLNGLKEISGGGIVDMSVYAPLDGAPNEEGDAYNYDSFFSDMEGSEASDIEIDPTDELMLGDEADNFLNNTNFPYAQGALSEDDGYDDGHLYNKLSVPIPQMDVSVTVEESPSLFGSWFNFLGPKNSTTKTEPKKSTEYIQISVRTEKKKNYTTRGYTKQRC